MQFATTFPEKLLGWRLHYCPGEAETGQPANEDHAEIDLTAVDTEACRGGKGVMVVVSSSSVRTPRPDTFRSGRADYQNVVADECNRPVRKTDFPGMPRDARLGDGKYALIFVLTRLDDFPAYGLHATSLLMAMVMLTA